MYLSFCLCFFFVYLSACLCLSACMCVCVSVCQAKRKYYEKSQQADTSEMTLNDAHTLKSTYTQRKWESVRVNMHCI